MRIPFEQYVEQAEAAIAEARKEIDKMIPYAEFTERRYFDHCEPARSALVRAWEAVKTRCIIGDSEFLHWGRIGRKYNRLVNKFEAKEDKGAAVVEMHRIIFGTEPPNYQEFYT